jgi:alkylation response protein AidB-like acyl-CoA dehydrogenase
MPKRAAAPDAALSDAGLQALFAPVFERIANGAVHREQQRELPFEPVKWLREAGFGALRVPLEYGGRGATLPQLFRLLVELGKADSNLPQIFRAHFAFVEERLNSDDAPGRERWLRRVAAGELFGAAMSERAEATQNSVTLSKEGEEWVLNGEKYYCTGTLYADWIAAAAVDGEERLSLAVPTTAPGVTRVDDWDGFGQRLTGSGTTRFEQVRLREEHIVRRFAPGEVRSDYVTAFYQLFHIAALAGIARAVLADGVAFVQAKTRAFGTLGTSSPRTDPLVQRVIGRLASLSFTADSLVEGVSAAVEEAYQARIHGADQAALNTAAEIKAFQAQQLSIQLVLEATTLLFEVGGASATSETRRLDRHWRNARTLASHNPAIYRERAVGDYYLNGTPPAELWAAQHRQAATPA